MKLIKSFYLDDNNHTWEIKKETYLYNRKLVNSYWVGECKETTVLLVGDTKQELLSIISQTVKNKQS